MADPRPARRRYDLALWVDRYIGPVLCALLLLAARLTRRRRTPPPPGSVRRVLLLKMWGMGSIVLASPLFPRLRALYPEARIDFVSLRENEGVLRLYPQVDRVIPLELGRGVAHFLRDALRALRQLRRERYDLLLDLEFFTRFSAIFSFLVAPARSHGFSAKGKWRGRLHDLEVPFNAYSHVTQNFLMLLAGDHMHPVDGEAVAGESALPRLVPAEGAWERCLEKLAGDPAWREGRPLVVVNPNAGDMALERRWPAERVAELADRLLERHDINLVLIGAAAERAHVAQVASTASAGERLLDFAGRCDLGELVALLAHAAVVVTNDSGPMHVAAAAGASTVALFGPETPTLYGPLRAQPGQRHELHYLRLGCSPCMFVHDNKVLSCWFSQARCMTGISVAAVQASVEALLAGARRSPQLRVIDR